MKQGSRGHLRYFFYLLWGAGFLALLVAILLNSHRLASEWEEEDIRALRLLDSDGKLWDVSRLGDRVALTFFGYTFCPDVCPTALARLSAEVEFWRQKGHPLVVLFITVDPRRDTPAVLKEYTAHFGEHVIGLTGSPQQLEKAMAAFGVSSKRVGTDEEDYLVNHSAKVFALNSRGGQMLLLADDDFEPLGRIIERSLLPEFSPARGSE